MAHLTKAKAKAKAGWQEIIYILGSTTYVDGFQQCVGIKPQNTLHVLFALACQKIFADLPTTQKMVELLPSIGYEKPEIRKNPDDWHLTRWARHLDHDAFTEMIKKIDNDKIKKLISNGETSFRKIQLYYSVTFVYIPFYNLCKK